MRKAKRDAKGDKKKKKKSKQGAHEMHSAGPQTSTGEEERGTVTRKRNKG